MNKIKELIRDLETIQGRKLKQFIVSKDLQDILETYDSKLQSEVIEALCSMNWDREYSLNQNEVTIKFKFPKAYMKYFLDASIHGEGDS